MDAVTSWFASLDHPLLTYPSLLVHEHVYPLTLLLFIATIPFFSQKRRLLTIFVGLVLLLFATLALKNAYAELRPCDASLPDAVVPKVSCPRPPDYSFPSGHAVLVFFFLAATIGTGAFLPYYLLALFTAFSRLYLGVHFLSDVVAGMVVGVLGYAVAERITEAWVR
ncbi:MAG: phosphatase PAP2 family protein [Candidatus Micrarchaeia archaeon]